MVSLLPCLLDPRRGRGVRARPGAVGRRTRVDSWPRARPVGPARRRRVRHAPRAVGRRPLGAHGRRTAASRSPISRRAPTTCIASVDGFRAEPSRVTAGAGRDGDGRDRAAARGAHRRGRRLGVVRRHADVRDGRQRAGHHARRHGRPPVRDRGRRAPARARHDGGADRRAGQRHVALPARRRVRLHARPRRRHQAEQLRRRLRLRPPDDVRPEADRGRARAAERRVRIGRHRRRRAAALGDRRPAGGARPDRGRLVRHHAAGRRHHGHARRDRLGRERRARVERRLDRRRARDGRPRDERRLRGVGGRARGQLARGLALHAARRRPLRHERSRLSRARSGPIPIGAYGGIDTRVARHERHRRRLGAVHARVEPADRAARADHLRRSALALHERLGRLRFPLAPR